MIIVELSGGLGNQMFQYSYGRFLSLQTNSKLYYFFSQNKHNTQREYALNIFYVKGKLIKNIFVKLFFKFLILVIPKKLFMLSHIDENSSERNIGSINIITGIWQDERYFSEINEIIRKDYKFKNILNRQNTIFIKNIRESNSVSIHIRRGDYITNSVTNSIHGVCDLKYYSRAIDYIKNRVVDPCFFIFSDDPIWVRKNFKIANDNNTVNWNSDDNNYIDMQLMSECKHNIIANSSFSWWAAWLNKNPNKIVIAPQKWFKKISSNNIIPKTWIRI